MAPLRPRSGAMPLELRLVLVTATVLVALTALGAVPGAAAAGKTRYVNPAQGTDGAGNCTAVGTGACKTIAGAIAVADTDDTISLVAGTYVMSTPLNLAGKTLTIEAPAGSGATTVSCAPTVPAVVQLADNDGLSWTGLTFTNCNAAFQHNALRDLVYTSCVFAPGLARVGVVSSNANAYFHHSSFQVNATVAGLAAVVTANQNATITTTNCSFSGAQGATTPYFLIDTVDFKDTGSTASGNTWATFIQASGDTSISLTGTTLTANTGTDTGAIYATGATKVILDGVTATGNSGSVAGVVYSKVGYQAGTGAHTVLSALDCTFTGNSASAIGAAGGGAMDLTLVPTTASNKATATGVVNFTNCILSGNQARNGGALQLTSVESTITGGQITGNKATVKGGGVAFITSGSLAVRNVNVSANSALLGGAFNVDDPKDLTSGYFDLESCTVERNTAGQGGVLAVTAEVQALRITGEHSTFTGNTATEEGGCFWYQGSGAASFSNCTFQTGFAPTGGVLRQASTFVSKFSSCVFTRNHAYFGAAASTDGNSRAECDDCTVTQNSASNEGGFSYSKGTSVVAMRNSRVVGNTATRGGAFFGQDDTNTTLDYCQLLHNTADNGAVAYMLGDVTNGGRPFFLVADSHFTNNTADFGGVEFASVATFSTLDRSNFTDNRASASGGVYYVSGGSNIAVSDCTATNNKASFDGGFGYIADVTTMTVRGTDVRGCTALRGGAFFATDQSVAVLDTCVLQGNSGSMGGAINLDGVPYSSVNARMNITNSKLLANEGTSNGVGGAAFLSGTTTLRLLDCDLVGNLAQFGGVLYSRDTAHGVVTLCRGSGNSAWQGGVVYGDTASLTTISGSDFENNTAVSNGGVVYVTNLATADISGGRFVGNRAMVGGVVATALNSKLNLRDATMSWNNATLGGCVYLEGTSRAQSTGTCLGCTLEGNYALQNGGALWIGEAAEYDSSGCAYLRNEAPVGGAVFAEQRIKSGDTNNCLTFKFAGDRFIDNVATVSGGVLSWNLNDNQTFSPCKYCGRDFTDCEITGNTAGLFRPNTSTPLVASIFVSSGHWLETETDRTTNGTVSAVVSSDANTTVTVHTTTDCVARDVRAQFPTITSGVAVGPTLVVSGKDFYGQEFTDPDSRANLVVSVSDVSGTGEAQLGGQTVATTVLGEVYFSNLIIIGKPGSIQQIRFSVLEPTQIEPLDMWVQMRECRFGEVQPINSNRCTMCPRNKYSWDPNEQVCHDCPANADCPGGSEVIPLAGYWRSGNTSTDMHACPRPQSCLGAAVTAGTLEFPEQDQDNPPSCEEGYTGRLCHRCQPGYGRSGADGCAPCPDATLNLLLIATGVTVAFGVMGFLIYTTRKSAKNEKDLMMMMIKIFMSYVQFVSLAAGLEIDWPSSLTTLFRAQQGAGSVTELFISFDCALETPAAGDLGNTDLFYKTQILYFFIPFMGVTAIILFWTGMYLFRGYCRRSERRTKGVLRVIMRENAIVSCIVLLFFMHPTLTTRTFMMFACQEVDKDEFYLAQDLNIQCYTVEHTLWIMSIGLPAVIIFVIGIPLGAFIVLYRRKAILMTEHCKATFGFLYSGFEMKFFYWECVIMIRKVLVISIVVFFTQFGALVQTGAALGLVYLAYNAHIWAMPYEADVLDDLEKYSLLTSLFTFFAGIFLNAPTIDEGWSLFLVVLIFIAQIGYLLFFVNTIRGEVAKKVEEKLDVVKSKVLRNKSEKPDETRELTDAEKQTEAEYQARMRRLEAERAAKGGPTATRKRPAPRKQPGFFSRMFGGNKRPAPPKKGVKPKIGGRRRNPRAAGAARARNVHNPLNSVGEAEVKGGAGSAPVPRVDGSKDVHNPLNAVTESPDLRL